MPKQPFIVIKLRAGWSLVGDGRSVVGYGQRTTVDLPSGARLVPALRLPPVPEDEATPAEIELARYVHLLLPPGMSTGAALVMIGGWTFVERATEPPGEFNSD